MKHLVLLLALSSLTRLLLAQTPGTTPVNATRQTARITGTVLHATTQQPVEFATVALLSKATDKILDGTTCDEKGVFSFPSVAAGEYKVTVSFVGFETRLVDNVRVTSDAGTINLGALLLTATAQQLGEVTVTGQKELVQTRPDGLVYNAEKDISNNGGNAADLLKKVPLLTVDNDGNVELRGTSSVRVLINGKPSSIIAKSVADALRRLPASQVKSVEVITSPSAKYDAEGSGGVINIILKKNSLNGLTGSVEVSAGTRYSNVNSDLTVRRGKFGINTSVGSYAHYNRGLGLSSRTDFLAEGVAQLDQQTRQRSYGGGVYGQVNFDYDATEKDVFSLGANTDLYHSGGRSTLASSYFAPGIAPDVFTRTTTRPWGPNWWPELSLNAGYTHTFKPKQEFSLLALYSGTANTRAYNLAQNRPELEDPDYYEISRNRSTNRTFTFQTDYTHALDSTGTLEAGAKTILRNESSAYRIEADSVDGRGLQLVPTRSDEFRYQQNVYAGYLSYGLVLRKVWSGKVGLRAEHTSVDGDFVASATTVRQRYTNLIPTLLVSHDFGQDNGQKLKLSYARRIQRPSIYVLNPYLDVSNRLVASAGNPNLRAELTDAYELGYSTNIKRTSLNFSGYWRQTNNAIQTVAITLPANQLIPGDTTSTNVLYSTFQNLARRATYGGSLFGSTKLTEKLTLNASLNAYYTSIKSPAFGSSNGGWVSDGNLSAAWELPRGFSSRVAYYYSTRRVLLQGLGNGYQSYDLSVKKELFDKKGSLTFSTNNPFNQTMRFRTNRAVEGQYTAADTWYGYNRSFRLSFSYQFGSLEGGNRNRKKIQNDDQTGGGK